MPLQRGSLGRSHAASREQEGEERPGAPGGQVRVDGAGGDRMEQRGPGAAGGRCLHLASQTGLVSGILTWVSHFGPFLKSSDLMMRLFFL